MVGVQPEFSVWWRGDQLKGAVREKLIQAMKEERLLNWVTNHDAKKEQKKLQEANEAAGVERTRKGGRSTTGCGRLGTMRSVRQIEIGGSGRMCAQRRAGRRARCAHKQEAVGGGWARLRCKGLQAPAAAASCVSVDG